MLAAQVPYQKLFQLREALGLAEEDLAALREHGAAFRDRRDDFAVRFHASFLKLAETRKILEHEERPRFLLSVWAEWYERLFRGKVDEGFLAYLWAIGTRHVEVNLDQRFSNLGFSLARQFCHQVAEERLAADARGPVLRALDKLLDLCLLVETTAYIETAMSCNLEVIRGVADRVRTPATVIGGNLHRLLRKEGDLAPAVRDTCTTLLFESRRLETMVSDIETYSHLVERPAQFERCAVEHHVRRALRALSPPEKLSTTETAVDLHPEAREVEADPGDLEHLLRCLLQNALDAAEGEPPKILVRGTPAPGVLRCVELEIFNTGIPPDPEELDQLFSPFYSTKPWGTGFGLAIARLAVQRNFGKLRVVPAPGEGTRVLVTLSAC